MGSSGTAYSVRPIKGKPQSTRSVLYDAVRAFLVEQWKGALPRPQLKMAKDWILLGEDSLLTVGDPDEDLDEPATEILFMFYETVDWPLALASHWLELALASGRAAFEKMLATHGYQLAAKRFPTLETIEGRFFVSGRKIGHPEEDEVFWQYPESDSTEYDELPKKVRALAEAVREGKSPCGCPYCAHLGRGGGEAPSSP